MTEWEIKWCHCFERCRALLELRNLRQDTREFVESVYLAISAYPSKYPSDKQAYWIHKLYQQHCRTSAANAKVTLELQGAGW